jgi:hypothetical protein
VPVFTSPVCPQLGAFLYRFCFRHGMNISIDSRARKYQFGQYFKSD